jgi:hypothetical protein
MCNQLRAFASAMPYLAINELTSKPDQDSVIIKGGWVLAATIRFVEFAIHSLIAGRRTYEAIGWVFGFLHAAIT